ncbi:extracellular matrix protein 14 [Entomortierella parvispora]|uniref:Carboxypeptidase M14A n=1 Tax=Entomortierella parvispora TaxID=205924 RepID=A0A9P3HHE4_9FUNG|nr:extracellular matrix protein 14 [Entomortierella parvispora]
MRSTFIPLALTLAAVAAMALPQQIPFVAPHPPTVPQHHALTNTAYARFDHDQVLRVQVANDDELKQLEAVIEEQTLDLWSNLRIGTVDVRIPRSNMDAFKSAVSLPHSVMIENLQELVPEQAPASIIRSHGDWNFTDNSFWASYHDLATLNSFTEAMVQQFPDLVKRTSMGTTHEGREVFGMTIHGFQNKKKSLAQQQEDAQENNDEVNSWWSWLIDSLAANRSSKNHSKPEKHPKEILFHGGQHAREWIGPAVVSYIAKELILGYGTNKKITRLVDQFEFTIVPVLNADGYAYTWEHNRMWRKNREPTFVPFCPGIDPNRNWGYKWNNGGSSSNPCSEAYQGPEPFAAKEPKMIADYILKKGNVVSYIDFHAYSQLWMSPFGADCTSIPKDNEDIMEAGMGAAKALKDIHGTKFAVGSVCNIIYQASGGSLDWTYATGGVKYSYAVELRDTGRHGFLLPEDQILPSSEETFAGVLHLSNFIRKREKQWGYMS